MGEIADALRRAGPLDRLRAKQHHGGDSQGDRSLLPHAPESEPTTGLQQPVETEPKAPEHQVHRLLMLEDGGGESLPARVSLDDPQGHSAQQYRRLAIRLRDLANSQNARSIVITSTQAGEGKTTTACNLAVALATTDHDSQVVLVDLDLHRASIASSLGIQVDSSIEGVLRGEFTLEQATMKTDVDGLFILAASHPAKKSDELLASHTLSATLAELERRFDWVIIDTPPILATSDAQVILQYAATTLIVVQAGVSPVRALHKAIEHLPKKKILASFLNSNRTKNQQYRYYSDYYRDSDELEPALSMDAEEIDEFDVKRI